MVYRLNAETSIWMINSGSDRKWSMPRMTATSR
jgi:hypothetical protein